MNRHGRNALLVIVGIYLLAFAALVGFSMFQFPGRDVLPAFRLNWILWNGVALFIEHLPTIHVTALLLLYSLIAGIGPVLKRGGRELAVALRGPLVLCTTIAMLFAVGVGILHPYAVGRRDGYAYRSRFAAALLREAEQSEWDGDYQRAELDYALYLRIDPENEDIRRRFEAARARAQQIEGGPESEEPAPFRAAALREGPDATELTNRAAQAFDAEDYFSAHYYGRLALALDSGREEARRLVASAYDRMRAYGETLEEAQQRELYERKRRAHQLLFDPSAENIIEAYYAFSDLHAEFPQDREVQRYYPVAREAIQNVSFFLHEIERAEGFPARHNLTFRNYADLRHYGDDQGNRSGRGIRGDQLREFVHIDRLVIASGGRYALGIEAIGFDAAGNVAYHLQADYGRIEQRDANDGEARSYLNMRAVDRGRRTVTEPRYLTGGREPNVGHVLQLGTSVRRLELAAAEEHGLQAAVLPDLLEKARLYPAFGFSVEPVYIEIGMRLLLPFSLLILSLLAISLGIRWRSHYLGRVPLMALLACVALPPALHYLLSFYFFALRVLLGALTLSSGIALAAAVMVPLHALLLGLALYSVAGQMMRAS